MGLDISWLSLFNFEEALNGLTVGLWNMASNTSLPVQHANQSASVRRSVWTSRLALRGYGCTTVRYLGSLSGGGGVGSRLVILSRQCMGDLKRTQSYARDEGAAFMQENLLRLLRRPVSQLRVRAALRNPSMKEATADASSPGSFPTATW